MLNRILQSWIFTAVLVSVVVLFSISVVDRYNEIKSLDKEVATLQDKIDELNLGNQELIDGINDPVRESDFEREARIKLNYKDPEEKVIYVYRNTETSEVQGIDEITEIRKISNLYKWWNYTCGI